MMQKKNEIKSMNLNLNNKFVDAEVKDSKFIRCVLNVDNGQTESIENDLQSTGKRARIDIDSSIGQQTY